MYIAFRDNIKDPVTQDLLVAQGTVFGPNALRDLVFMLHRDFGIDLLPGFAIGETPNIAANAAFSGK